MGSTIATPRVRSLDGAYAPIQNSVDGRAEFSDDGLYRYWLSRDWGLRRFSDGREPYALWIGMNPSTADASVNDPTVAREIAFTRRAGLSRYVKVNVMDYRATSPVDLLAPGVEPRSYLNLETIRRFAERAEAIVCCWGRLHPKLTRYTEDVERLLRGRKLNCLGRNADGSPKHPLYLRSDARFESYSSQPRGWKPR